MKKKRIPFIIICCLILSLYSKAQLSGIYTIGGSSPDFLTLSAAVSSLNSNGVSGPVVFNIRNGIYNESVALDSIAGVTSQNTITFQSESGDSSLVIVTSNSMSSTIWIENSDYILLNKITIINTFSSGSKTIYISDSKNISIENCHLSCSNDIGSGTIFIPNFTGATNKISIKNSYIFSPGNGILADALNDSLLVENNIIDGDIELTKAKVSGNLFLDDLYDSRNYYCSFISNNFDTVCIAHYWKYNTYESNTFQSLSYFIFCDSSTFRDNYFYKLNISYGPYSSFINNCFDSLSIGYSKYSTFASNRTNYFSEIMYSSHLNFIGNRIYNDFDFIYNDTCNIINNCIYKKFTLNFSDRCKILFNNFPKNSALTMSTTCQIVPEVKYNNFYDLIPFGYLYQNNTIDYNNYYPAVNTTETHPYHIDPMYGDSIHLKASNPMLSGKAYSTTVVPYDIDSVVRNYPYTIGPNEICISALQPDTFYIGCSESIQLQLCDKIDSAVYIWTPVYCINDPGIYNPIVNPAVDTTYHISVYLNSVLIASDSFRISVSQLPIAGATFQMNLSTVHFINESKCATSYHWDFGDGASSTDVNPIHQYTAVGFYTVTLIAYNGAGSDTISFPMEIYNLSAINENAIGFSYDIFPNPCSNDFIVLNIPSFIYGNNMITIYNIQGQMLFRQPILKEKSEIDVSMLSEGIYILKINYNNGVAVNKIVKQ